MTPKPQANTLGRLEEEILNELHYDGEYCRGYAWIDHLAFKPELKKAIKHLKELKYIEYYRGLMSEDGEVGGAGWCRSNLGNQYVEEQIMTPKPQANKSIDEGLDKWLWNLVVTAQNPNHAKALEDSDLSYTKYHIKQAITQAMLDALPERNSEEEWTTYPSGQTVQDKDLHNYKQGYNQAISEMETAIKLEGEK